MLNSFGIIATIIFVVSAVGNVRGETSWTYDILEIKVINKTPHIVDFKLKTSRISRGIYGIEGYFDVKQDLNDSLYFAADLFRSNLYGPLAYYSKLPMKVANTTLSVLMNEYYKKFIMNTLYNCTASAPYFEEEFVPPITKRYIGFTQCRVSEEELNFQMNNGYYKFVATTTGQVNAVLEVHTHTYGRIN